MAICFRVVAITATLLFIGACRSSDDAATRSAAVVRDSAGVTVVETPDLSAVDSLSWSVGAAPDLVIGVTDGEAPYLLSRIVGVVRLSDRRIAVADGTSDEIRLFDEFGHFLHATGGTGNGPGEYRGLTLLERFAGDSLIAFDSDGVRATVLTPNGEPVRRFRAGIRSTTGNVSMAMVSHVFADGTFLISEGLGRRQTEGGVFQVASRLARISQDHRKLTTYSESEYSLQFVNRQLVSGGERPPERLPAMWIGGADKLFYTANPTGLDFRRYAASGDVERVFRVQGFAQQDPTVTGERWPDFRVLAVDASGHLWVRVKTEGAESSRWIIFDPAGEPRYALRLPSVVNRLSFGPTMEIGADYVLAASQNADGAPVVVLYHLRKQEISR
jgi:6-bladed beta-propeller